MKRSDIKIGKKVIFWKEINKTLRKGPTLTVIESEVFGAGDGFCELKGLGMSPISNIDPVNAGNLFLAKYQKCKGVTKKMIDDLFYRSGGQLEIEAKIE